MSDPRFRRLKSDPRFRSLKRHKNKVAVDSRFSSLFKKQSDLGRVDKYGRQLSDVQDDESLRRFYKTDPVEYSAGPDYARGEVLLESSDEENSSSEDAGPSDDENEDIVVLGRDTDRLVSEDADVNLDEDGTLYPKIAPENEQESSHGTHRIAVVDLDWDYVRATHLYKIFSSAISPVKPTSRSDTVFTPAVPGKVLSVRVYPSKFGLERMAHEENGPPVELFKKKMTDYEEDVNERTIYETGNSGEYDEDALRTYQLERLRYYYAIVECDTVRLATHLYSELLGAELERSANVLNLSFVPDDMTFDEECRDQATSADESTNHQPLDFTTDALRHSKVKLTWDEDDAERDRVTRRTLSLKDIEENDFRAYIASSSDEEHEGEAKSVKKSIDRDKLRALLLEGGGHDLPEGWAGSKPSDLGDDGRDVDMEVTFRPALTGGKDEDETTLGKYQRKMREKRKKRRNDLQERIEGKPSTDDFFAGGEEEEDSDRVSRSARGRAKDGQRSESRGFSTTEELSLLVAPDQLDSEPKHFDMAAIIKAEKSARKKHKGSKKKNDNDENEIQDDFVIDVKDERFTALHEDHAFAIDPSHPNFKKTQSMSALLGERSKRKTSGDQTRAAERVSQGGTRQTLSSLVESVKRKGVTVGDSGTKRRKV